MGSSLSPNKSLLSSMIGFVENHTNRVLSSLHNASIDVLKAVVTAARYTEAPREDTHPLYDKITRPIWEHLLQNDPLEARRRDVMDSIQYLAAPPFSSHLLNLALLVDPSKEEILHQKYASMFNEVSVNEQRRRPPVINWDAIFRPERDLNLLSAPRNQAAHEEINAVMSKFKYDMEHVTLIPFGSSRGVSSVTQAYARKEDNVREWKYSNDFKEHYSAKDLVNRFMSGVEEIPEGPCQMKQKWYPTGLKPRTYYAQGGTALKNSMYIRSFFNELADRFPYTNRFRRVDVTRFHIKSPDKTKMFVYDYSNFTSNFSEQYHFLTGLADFMDGIEVFLLRPDLTVASIYLSELIFDYRDYCNDLPEYYTEDGLLGLEAMMMVHNQAGFLGVYGNLMTCTVPHGFVARELVDFPDELGTAGDDGIIEPRYPIDETVKYLNSLGKFALSKCYTFPNVIYLKRRVDFHPTYGLTLRPYIQFPTYSVLSTKFGRLSDRFTHMREMPYDRHRFALYSSIVTCVRDYVREDKYHHFGHDSFQTFTEIINSLIQFGQLNAPGRLEFNIDRDKMYRRGPLFLLEDTFPVQSYARYPAFLNRFPVRRRCRDILPFRIENLTVGDEIRCNSDGYVKILEMSGYIVEEEDDDVDFEEVYDLDFHLFLEQGPEIRRYKVVRDVDAESLMHMVNRPLERLHKRKLGDEDFERFSRVDRVSKRLMQTWKRGYVDPDAVNEWAIGDLWYDEYEEEENVGVPDLDTIGESLESEFRKNVSVMLW